MERPPQSPDLNIIEAFLDYFDWKKLEKQPTTPEELLDVLRDAWNNILSDFLQEIQDSIPHRIEAVLKKKRGPYKILNVLVFLLFFCVFYEYFCKQPVLKFTITTINIEIQCVLICTFTRFLKQTFCLKCIRLLHSSVYPPEGQIVTFFATGSGWVLSMNVTVMTSFGFTLLMRPTR